MSDPRADPALPPDLLRQIQSRLGCDPPPRPDVEGLRQVYGAWCRSAPFDNVRKMMALATAPADRALPGTDPEGFFEAWLRDGTGGTCWPTSLALQALLAALGFEARLVAGSMRDLGRINHGSVKVRISGRDWLADSSLLSNAPLPLGDEVFISTDPVFVAEVEPSGESHVVWSHTPPNPTHMPCRLLIDAVSRADCARAYEESRSASPFNQRLYARRNHPGALVVLLGRTRAIRTPAGVESRDLARDEFCDALRHDIGLSAEMVSAWIASGALEASFEPPSGPKPPPITTLPPSRRGTPGATLPRLG